MYRYKKKDVCSLTSYYDTYALKLKTALRLTYFNNPKTVLPAATDWVVAQEELSQNNLYCIKNLTSCDVLHVRVVAVNRGGRSEPGSLAEPVLIREIGGE